MKKILLIVFYLVLYLNIFSQNSISPLNDNNKNLNSNLNQDSLQVVLNDSIYINRFCNSCSSWIPTSKDYSVIDKIILKAITENKDIYKLEKLNVNTYRNYFKQLVCYIDEKNDSIVYINALCYDSNFLFKDNEIYNWNKQLIIVNDGGECYWTIKINISKHSFFDFYVNDDI
jgi:hypothetical protein